VNHIEYDNTLQALKQQIWQIAGQDLGKVQAAADKASVKLPVASVGDAEKILRKMRKPAKRKVMVSEEAFRRLREAKLAYQTIEYPHWVRDGHFIEPDKPDNSTANGIQNYIIDFLTWSGHFANRTGNEGRVIMVDGKPKRIPSSSKNGMQDIDTNLKHPDHPFGIPWKIEVKAPGDTHKKHQIGYGELVQKTGGVYSVVWSIEDFLRQYDKLMVVKPKQGSIFA
jgi:hypothetical protein